MKTLSIDIETYSSVDLAKCGVYKYTESPDFENLLFGYSINGDSVRTVDLACGETIPPEVIAALTNDRVIKWAFNAQFERVCLSRRLRDHDAFDNTGYSIPEDTVGNYLDPASWKCTMVWSAYMGMPLSLECVGAVLGLGKQKLTEGKELIKYFCQPCAPTKSNGGRTRNCPYHALDNPNSVQQMKQWLADNGFAMDSLGKKEVAAMIKTAPTQLQRAPSLRQQLAKSSVKKYLAMEKAVCVDGRARGMFQFYGANRTGRWAGRIIQLQNLPQNHLPDLEQARGLVLNGNFEAVEALYEDVPDTLSQLIRTAFIPRPGYKFIAADFSAIEARVLAWLAGETWRQKIFEQGGDIYCASASQMFRVPVEKHGVNGHLRQKGKIAELALGYGGSVGALKAMGALEMGLAEEELQPLVTAWRNSNRNIVKFWWAVDRAAMETLKYRTENEVCGIRFTYQSGMLFITLPSGRNLAYVKPKIGTNKFGSECSPYAGDVENNVAAARRYCRFAVEVGYILIAPHLLFTQFLDDRNPREREPGLFFGNALLSKCAEMWVFGNRISEGMETEIKRAAWKGHRIRYFTEEYEEVPR